MARPPSDIAGVLLAGGLSRRMGGSEKCLLPLGGKPLLLHVLDRARGQVTSLMLSANGDPSRFAAFDLSVHEDVVPGHAGPLAGILTGFEWAAQIPGCVWLASFATDAPFLPRDLVFRLREAAEGAGADIALARSGGQVHPVFGLWRVGLEADLRHALVDEKIHRIRRWTERHLLAYAEFETEPVDPFFNINAPEDLARAEELLGQGRRSDAATPSSQP
jgi:molybdopterin-guanine dinucleotide biosynthesis protein A